MRPKFSFRSIFDLNQLDEKGRIFARVGELGGSQLANIFMFKNPRVMPYSIHLFT